ncbi:d-lactate dehydrogenase cytochrome [Fusarium sporotrichioides]|uniref:D-lactate dehydrogenase cytochrome n=1 Tax=Fusarium sporotrichioides TaxID=5514 RepID=A0A395SDH5_FUSSP|nr:d-lactate dehydrogenase cytochrome [Fusarium sporotrichioides]
MRAVVNKDGTFLPTWLLFSAPVENLKPRWVQNDHPLTAMSVAYADKKTMLKAVDEIRELLGEEAVSTDWDDLEEHGHSEWSTSNSDSRPVAVIRPQTTEQVSAIARICTTYRVPMVPYGAGSSVEGNFSSPHSGVCLDLSNMNKIVAFHPDDMDIVVQAGVNWTTMNQEIKRSGLFLPLDPSPTALIGGMVSTNCSGTNAMRYGTMKDYVINLTVVLADGSVIKTRRRPRKTSAGYNLTGLFVGSEGTLGIVTEATLKLAIIPEKLSVATATFSTVKEAADMAFKLMRQGVPLAALELMDDTQMKVVNQSGGAGGRMWDECPTLFLKFSGSQNAVKDSINSTKEIAKSQGCRSFEFAETQEQMDSLWSARKQALWASLAVRDEGTQMWSTDVAVPLSQMAEIIEESKEKASHLGIFNSVMGHVGDGNFHQLMMYNPKDEDQRQAVSKCVDDMMVRALEMEGTVSGEHGIGLGKMHCLQKELGPATIGVMKAIKDTLDPWARVMADQNESPSWRRTQLNFVPINQADSPPESKRRRTYLSCERCRKRKTRCEPTTGEDDRCMRCSLDDQRCEFRNSRSTKRVSSIRATTSEETSHHRTIVGRDPNTPISSQLEAISGAASTSQSRHTNDEFVVTATESSSTHSTTAALDARTRLVSTYIHNTSDALDLITFASAGRNVHDTSSLTPGCDSQAVLSAAPTNAVSDPPHSGDGAWKGFILIRKGIISRQEVKEYLDFFFQRLWPLKPVIPSHYLDQKTHGQLVAEEPLLVVCIVALSSRYSSLSGSHGEIRSERIHWQVWGILQRSLQSVMWGSATTRSLGAISSMLLLIDWHVKAINNPADFTEGDDEAWAPSSKGPDATGSSSTGQRRYWMMSIMEKLDIVSPAYRSNKMSWMLLSNSIALAHEGSCFQVEQSNSSINASSSKSDSIKQEWNRLVCVFIHLADEGLATRLGLEPLLPEKSRQAVKERFALTFADSIPNGTVWESYFELSIEARKGRELLNSLRSEGTLHPESNLINYLDSLRRSLARWKRLYYHASDTNILLHACLRIEYYYVSMFCFAPASQAVQSKSQSILDDTLQALHEFEDQATQASNALLCIVVDELKPSGLTQFLPVRCWLFIVSACLHLLKSTLTESQHVNQAHPNIQVLHRVINAIHSGSPDDTHMAIRFAKFLGIMVHTVVPSLTSSHVGGIAPGVEAGKDNGGIDLGLQPGDLQDITSGSLDENLVVDGLSDMDTLSNIV